MIGKKYKKSIYNIEFSEDKKQFVYNSLSNCFAELKQEEYKYFSNINSNENLNLENNDLLNKLVKGNFINNIMFNEKSYLKTKLNSLKSSNETLSLTITPTLSCNFRCPYCFENESNHETLSEENLERLIDFTKKNLEGKKKLDITWYGGEPLLKPEIINKYSRTIIDFCDENKIEYSAFIITNGYHLDEDMLHQMYWWRIRGVQITIDGPENIHNKTRILTNKKGSYETIIKNIKYACDKVNVLIRVNVSKLNKDHLIELLLNLKELELNKYIYIELSIVSAPTEESERFSNDLISEEEYSKVRIEFLKKAMELDFNINLYPNGFQGCSAINKNTYVIGGDSFIYKCWNNVGVKEESIGKLETGNKFNGHEFEWTAFSPFDDEECEKCNVLPLCLGKCPYYKIMKGKKGGCAEYKYDLIESLKLHKDYKSKLELKNQLGD